jgi:hypothetical protein
MQKAFLDVALAWATFRLALREAFIADVRRMIHWAEQLGRSGPNEEPMAPKIVVLCGSTRFAKEFTRENARLTADGRIVLAPGWFGHHAPGCQRAGWAAKLNVPCPLCGARVLTPRLKEELDLLHLRKIDLADEVFVVNVGGYVGDSTKAEIAYAERLGKPITYLEDLATDANPKELSGGVVTRPALGADPAEAGPEKIIPLSEILERPVHMRDLLPTRTFSSEPAPVRNTGPAVWLLVVQDMHARDIHGREKYRTPLQPNNGRNSLQDAYDEVLDLAVYLKKQLVETRPRQCSECMLLENEHGADDVCSGGGEHKWSL